MGSHLFKVELAHSDMFIRKIDIAAKEIEYEVRDKIDGKLLEPSRVSKCEITKDKLEFDNRFLSTTFAQHIQTTLT